MHHFLIENVTSIPFAQVEILLLFYYFFLLIMRSCCEFVIEILFSLATVTAAFEQNSTQQPKVYTVS